MTTLVNDKEHARKAVIKLQIQSILNAFEINSNTTATIGTIIEVKTFVFEVAKTHLQLLRELLTPNELDYLKQLATSEKSEPTGEESLIKDLIDYGLVAKVFMSGSFHVGLTGIGIYVADESYIPDATTIKELVMKQVPEWSRFFLDLFEKRAA